VYEPGGRVSGREWDLQEGGGRIADKLDGWTYDAAGRLASIPGRIDAITYDASDRPLTTIYAKGGGTTRRTYDPKRGWLTRLEGPGLDLTYTRDLAGRILSIRGPSAESFAFTYNEADWLLSSARGGGDSRQAFAYDIAGNMTAQTGPSSMGATFPTARSQRPHAPLTVSRLFDGKEFRETQVYDNNGNLLQGGRRTIAWDGENRPEEIAAG
ncbi:hypothetical protein, partial [Microvirga brassicacearum]|uniref:hypothetical protein n=1 Tax=Microvirga brassicacearum TaxID=2580413 RepID=UPI0019127C09